MRSKRGQKYARRGQKKIKIEQIPQKGRLCFAWRTRREEAYQASMLKIVEQDGGNNCPFGGRLSGAYQGEEETRITSCGDTKAL
jgi:hypothetical protein